ncbi:hypothetical protein [Kitasatospora sp. NBC_00458]|uniref:hypothetical protein n=1 Tax=Kitasatospora sp. NBC_00458 TaxID=2903568 RepID=UPI002E17D2A6
MTPSTNIDQDAVLRARTMLLGTDQPSLGQQVGAYRVLAEANPSVHLPRLVRALLRSGWATELRDRPDLRLPLFAEAAAAARRIDAADPARTRLLVDALSGYQHQLYAAGRRSEGFAVCREMAEAGRSGFERGQVESPVHGHGRLAAVLAEEGRHAEAAAILGRVGRNRRSDDAQDDTFSAHFWRVVAWSAELDAAGLHGEALDAFAALVDDTRAEHRVDGTASAVLAWTLVRHAEMLDAAGRGPEAGTARSEALDLLTGLADSGEPVSWSNINAWWAVLLSLSGRHAEPAGTADAPAPPFGQDEDWSPDVRQVYSEGLPALEASVGELTARTAAHTGADGSGSCQHLAELVAVQRRLTIRTAVLRERRCYILEPLHTLFDEGVALARRLSATAEAADRAGAAAPGGRAALGRALTDRAMFRVAAKQYREARDDFREAVGLLG